MAVHGFLEWAEDYIDSNPGRTAQHIVHTGLASGAVASDAGNPQGSLVATLHKHHADHGRIVRHWDQIDRVYRFYPAGARTRVYAKPASPEPPTPAAAPAVTIGQLRNVADTLVHLGKFPNQADALLWLVQEQ